MDNGVTATTSGPPAAISASQERALVLLLGCAAAVHVFLFSAAFPFFNNVDEQIHFDLAVKYSQGHVPRALERVSAEATPYAVIYGTHEYLWASNNFPIEQFPPPWTRPMEKIAPKLLSWQASWNNVTNHEASQPPLYYTLAGLWWQGGKACGFHDGSLLYWVRFLNIVFVVALVWLGFVAARMIFPENLFLKIGVPALLAFFPQTAFYSIQNDVLSPLCFGAAFLCLVKFLRADAPGVRWGMATGLALAATYLTKVSNLPLLAVSAAVVLFKILCLAKAGKLRAAFPALAALVLCAALPISGWLVWTKYHFGDFTGTAAKIQFLGWTHKSFGEWWQHPIFTPHGLWTFVSGLMATFWQGEFLWHRQPLASPVVDAIYAISSVGFVGVAIVALLSRPNAATGPQRQALWFGFLCLLAAVAFLGFLSIIYDFQDCYYPSRAHPYFTSGRLMLGALIPFLLLFLYGMDCALGWIKNNWAKPLALAGLILFMLISEITIDWRIFPNAYNWFHM
ncbi:MAG: DUF2142 domain-containing protein [Verrucomicrobiia bacterium]